MAQEKYSKNLYRRYSLLFIKNRLSRRGFTREGIFSGCSWKWCHCREMALRKKYGMMMLKKVYQIADLERLLKECWRIHLGVVFGLHLKANKKPRWLWIASVLIEFTVKKSRNNFNFFTRAKSIIFKSSPFWTHSAPFCSPLWGIFPQISHVPKLRRNKFNPSVELKKFFPRFAHPLCSIPFPATTKIF